MAGTALNIMKATNGKHPTMRLDAFMKGTDSLYSHSEEKVTGNHFVRSMATYGRTRPSPTFTSQSRAQKPFLGKLSALDMSDLPPTWNDPRSDPREGTLEYSEPPQVDTSFMAAYENHGLMTVSERAREQAMMVAGEQQWRSDRAAIWDYNKRKHRVEHKHRSGVVGVDSALHEGTKLYANHRERNEAKRSLSARHAAGRRDHLGYQMSASDAASSRNYGEPMNDEKRSTDIPMQRKAVDPDVHPFRFLDTHNRIFPDEVAMWDRERAATLRSHDVRHKGFDIISGVQNSIGYLTSRT
jgi:hypothetical protein